jgi:cytochrome c biogenesis protein CcdA
VLSLVVASFLAGALTVLAPCVLPLLPVIVGGTVVRVETDGAAAARRWYRPLVIAAGLAVSVIAFTLLLKASTVLLGVPPTVWAIVSGIIVIGFGLTLVFPEAWDRMMLMTGLGARSSAMLDAGYRRGGLGGDLLLGAALGPTFSSCSPTYAIVVATVLPVSFGEGVLYITAYALGLALFLLLIALLGQGVARRLGLLTDTRGILRKVIGGVMILVGIGVAFGVDKVVQAFVIEQGWYEPIAQLEGFLLG